MNLEKVVFAFFIVLALTLNFGVFIAGLGETARLNVFELFAAIVVNLIATVLKLGDRTHVGAVLLATSLVADLQLIAGAIVWAVALYATETGFDADSLSLVVSLAGGALVANIVSVVLLMAETLSVRR